MKCTLWIWSDHCRPIFEDCCSSEASMDLNRMIQRTLMKIVPTLRCGGNAYLLRWWNRFSWRRNWFFRRWSGLLWNFLRDFILIFVIFAIIVNKIKWFFFVLNVDLSLRFWFRHRWFGNLAWNVFVRSIIAITRENLGIFADGELRTKKWLGSCYIIRYSVEFQGHFIDNYRVLRKLKKMLFDDFRHKFLKIIYVSMGHAELDFTTQGRWWGGDFWGWKPTRSW